MLFMRPEGDVKVKERLLQKRNDALHTGNDNSNRSLELSPLTGRHWLGFIPTPNPVRGNEPQRGNKVAREGRKGKACLQSDSGISFQEHLMETKTTK